MDAIELTRQLGKAIQEDEKYKVFAAATEANDKDEKLRLAQADYDKFLYYNGKVYGDHYGSGVQNVKENVDVTQIMNGQDTNMMMLNI